MGGAAEHGALPRTRINSAVLLTPGLDVKRRAYCFSSIEIGTPGEGRDEQEWPWRPREHLLHPHAIAG